jgi:PIN domain nuclease of toxin-antitoxin system
LRLLADTCTFLWMADDAGSLSDTARKLLADPENEVLSAKFPPGKSQ